MPPAEARNHGLRRCLALRFNLTSYAAACLELALRLQLPIATREDDLAEAAWAAGVGLLTP